MIISKKRLSPLNKFICILLTVCTHLFLLTLPINAPAQESKGLPFITNYHYRDYNADGINWWTTEDDNGIMYFANNSGVLIFDGQQWELIKVPGIQETRSLVKGTDGKIYVGTNGDLGYLAPGKKGKYEFISLKNKLPEQHRLFNQIWETHVFKGNVYSRSSNKIFIWDYKSFRVLESKEGFHVGAEVNNEYYCRIWTRGLCVLKNDSFHVVPNGEKFANERIYVMLPYDDKRILIGSRTQGLFIYDGNDFIPFKTEADPYILNTSLYGGRVLSNGLFALNTFNDGLVIIDKQGKLIQRIDKSVGLQDNSVANVFEDSRGILWMTLFNGIAKFDLQSSLTYYSESLGLPARTVFNVGSYNNKIYAGTNNGLYMLNSSTNRFEKVPGTSGQIGNFMRNGKDFLVAGAEKGLLKIIDGNVIPVIPGVNYDFHVSQILRSKIDTTIIYCDLRSGLAMVRYNPGTGKYSIEAFREGLSSAVGLFNETKQGNFWIAGDIPGELKLVKPEKKDGKLFLTEKSVEVYNHKQGLPNRGLIITEYDDKTYFIAQKDSIFLFDEKQNRFIQDTSIFLKNYAIDNADGTIDNPRDHLGRTWANFGTGVFVKIPTADGSLKIIDAPFRELGKNYPVWNITTTVDKNGKDVVWFSGREGIIRYDGSLDETTGGSFNTIIRGITLNEDSVYYSGFSIPLDNNAFSNKWNTIRFQYSAPFYKKENETLFSTLLEGKDKNWSDWTKQNFRDFGNLPAGKYNFKVKSRNIYDVESSIASFPFTVLAPWYATWWAYILYALAAIALIYGLIRWRTHQLHEKHRALEKTVKERTSQLSHRVEELAVINSVQEGLVREMNMQGIYELVGEKIRQIFNAQVIDIVTYDSKTNLMEDRYAYEKGDRTLVGTWEPKGFRKHVIESGQLLLINENLDVKSIEFNSQVIHGEQPKSALFVPMIAGNEVKGMISLQDLDKENAFKDSDVRLLTTLANSMSVALESARRFDETNRLLKETEQRNAELAVINSVQESLVAKMDMNGIYELVGEKIREIFDAQVIDIVTYDKNANQIEDRYAFEKGDRTMLGPRIPKGFRKHVIQTRQLLLHNENVEQKMKEFDNEILIGEMPKSQMYVPMIAGDEVKGIISLQNLDHEHAFSNSDVSLLTTLANSMSVALESARLFDETNRLLKETEQRTAELSVINSVQEGLARELDIQGVYELVGEKMREIFNAQVIDIVTHDKATNLIEDRYTFEKGDRSLLGPRPLKGFRKHVIETSKPLVINKGVDQQRPKYDQTVITGEGAKSIVMVPMIAGGEATGVISLQNLDQENAFPESDVNLLTTLANSMSVALENARLFDETNRLLKETEQRTAELAVINSVQEGLAKELDMQGIYTLVGDRVQKLFSAQAVIIGSFDLENKIEHFNYLVENGEIVKADSRPINKLRQLLIDKKKSIYITTEKQAREEYGLSAIAGTQMSKSLLFVPLLTGNIVKGYVSLQNVDRENAFSEPDVRLLETLANSMSVALENARLFDETNRLLKETEQRTAELAIINSVQEGLASKLDIQAIYDLVGDKIRDVFDTQGIAVSYYDQQTNFITNPYYLFRGKRVHGMGFELGKGLTSHIIQTGQPLLINEHAAERFKEYGAIYADDETEDTTKSWLGVPLISGGQVNGTIRLENYEREFAYNESDVSLLQTLANSMSVALENARLFDETNRLLKETEQRTAELAVINSVQEGLAKELDIQGIYDLVGERIRNLFDAQVVVIRTFDHTTGNEHLRYAIEKGERIYVEPRPYMWANRQLIKSKESLLINENYLETTKKYGGSGIPNPVKGQTPKSALFVPMMLGDVVKGSISLQNVDRENAFTESDLRLLTTLSNSMSVALENARLFDETTRLLKETEQRTAELAVINSVQEGLAKELDIQGIYNLVGDRLCDLFPDTQTLVIRTFDHETGLEQFQYAIEKGERLEVEPRPFMWASHQLIRTKKPVDIKENYLETAHKFGSTGVTKGQPPKSAVFVPMMVGDVVKGSISLQNVDRENAFSESDLRLLTTLTNSMSVALENARLFDETSRLLKETEQRTAELAVINSVQEGLARELDIKGIYELVGDRLCNLFPDTQTLVIRTFDHERGLELWQYAKEKGLRQYVEPRPFNWNSKQLINNKKPLDIQENYVETAKKYGGTGVTSGQPPKSALFVPMLVGDLVKGSVSLQNVDKEHAFTDSDMRLLTTITNSMSVALENARLFDETNRLLKETEQRTAELAVINSVQEGLVREMNMQAIYDLVGARICALFDTQTVIIRTFDHRMGNEQWQYAIEKGQRLYSNPRPFIWANKQLIETKQPLLINEDYTETAKKFGGAGVTKGLPPKSALFVPMIVGDVVRGSVSLQNVEKEHAFTESDLRLLTTLTNSMSVALENARLFDETNRLLGEAKQRANELSTVNNISQALASQLNIEDLIKLVGDEMLQLFRANIVYLAMLDKKSNMISFPYQYGDNLQPMKLGEGLTSKILLTGEPLLVNKDVGELTDKLGLQRLGIPAASYLGVPIPVGDEVIGVLSVQSTEHENRFNENDLRLLTTIATSLGVALRKAKLFEEVHFAKMEAEGARKTAEQANAAKSAFLSTVSHELRTPLTSVLGFAKIIKKRLEDKIFPITSGADPKTGKTIQQISENLKVVISEGERLTNLINEVLDLAKIEAGKMEWNMESVSMEEIAERAIAATSSLFENKNLNLRKFIDADLPVISGDKDKLIQVIVNLISNAVKFTPEGTVTCRINQHRDEIVVGISDTGIGIAPEDHEAVFEQFKQVVGDTLTDKPKGTGLGLPICKEIVEHHGGRIWLESELGKGSTFFFALSVQQSDGSKPIHLKDLVRQLKEQMAHSKLNIKGKNATILVVDDDDSIRSLLQQELSDAGYNIEEATNGKEALESIRKHRPDLIILDIMMPEINGFDVAAILKNDPQTMDIPIIVLSIVQDKARGYRIGVDRYLTKPIDTAQLFAEVGALLEQGKSKKKVMVVDEDSTSVKSLTEVLQAKGYQVVESDGKELIENAIKTQPDIIILNSVLSDKEIVQSLRFEKGLENVLFLIYNNQEIVTQLK